MTGNPRLLFRPAVPGDLEILRKWDRAPHVIAGKGDDDWNWDVELTRDPDWREMTIAELDGAPVGFMQVIDPAREETRYWGNCPAGLRAVDIWIGEEERLGQGTGTEMMSRAISRCFDDPSVDGILVDPLASNHGARRFYEKLGFQFVEERRLDETDCAVYRLDRPGWHGNEDRG